MQYAHIKSISYHLRKYSIKVFNLFQSISSTLHSLTDIHICNSLRKCSVQLILYCSFTHMKDDNHSTNTISREIISSQCQGLSLQPVWLAQCQRTRLSPLRPGFDTRRRHVYGHSGFLPHKDHPNANIGANEHD